MCLRNEKNRVRRRKETHQVRRSGDATILGSSSIFMLHPSNDFICLAFFYWPPFPTLVSSQFSSVQSLSRVRLFAMPWTGARRTPLSGEFSRQGDWSVWPLPPPGDLPDPGMELGSPVVQADSPPSEPPGRPNDGNHSKTQMLCVL